MSAFFREIADSASVWTIEDANGLPAPRTSEGVRAMPFWSKRSRAERIISTVEAYSEFTPREIPVSEWTSRWLPGLQRDGLLVGMNWSGTRAAGYDVAPDVVLQRLAGI